MAYTINEPILGVQPIANTDTVQRHPLGTIVTAGDPLYGTGEFIYLKGVASTTVGDVVEYDQYNGTTTRWAGTANRGKPLAVAMSANVASQYGWYQIGGAAVVNISGTVAAGDPAFFQATATVSTTAVAGKQMLNASAITANGVPSAGKAVYQIDRPFAQGQIT
jgi:hypothetical protein